MLRKWPTRRRTGGVSGVTFVTRTGCTLCAEALPVVERATRDAGVPLEVLDVDLDAAADPALREWSDHVPVVLLDGAVHSRWWVDEGKLRAALSAGSANRV